MSIEVYLFSPAGEFYNMLCLYQQEYTGVCRGGVFGQAE